MASANLDLVRSIFVAWERGDYFGSADWAHPEIEFVLADLPDRGSWRGVPEMLAAWRRWLSAWDDLRVEVDEYRELDSERVLVLTRYSGRARTNGVDAGGIRTTGAALFHLRDGKVTKFVGYIDRDRALADLGLAQEADA
jgi:ketosteroid isomerase-like protein